jgi:hypothetical protein
VILLSEAAPDLDSDSSDADVVASTVAALGAGFLWRRLAELTQGY